MSLLTHRITTRLRRIQTLSDLEFQLFMDEMRCRILAAITFYKDDPTKALGIKQVRLQRPIRR